MLCKAAELGDENTLCARLSVCGNNHVKAWVPHAKLQHWETDTPILEDAIWMTMKLIQGRLHCGSTFHAGRPGALNTPQCSVTREDLHPARFTPREGVSHGRRSVPGPGAPLTDSNYSLRKQLNHTRAEEYGRSQMGVWSAQNEVWLRMKAQACWKEKEGQTDHLNTP